jgi:hypothetical protein
MHANCHLFGASPSTHNADEPEKNSNASFMIITIKRGKKLFLAFLVFYLLQLHISSIFVLYVERGSTCCCHLAAVWDQHNTIPQLLVLCT